MQCLIGATNSFLGDIIISKGVTTSQPKSETTRCILKDNGDIFASFPTGIMENMSKL